MSSAQSRRPARRMIHEFRWRLGLTGALAFSENVAMLLYPFTIGLAVNDLVADSLRGLVVFVAMWLAHTVVAFVRQRLDTRTYTAMQTALVTEMVAAQRAAGVPTSSIVARSHLAQQFVDFLDETVPLLLAAAFGFVGSLVMLLLYDPSIGLAALVLVVPVGVLNLGLSRRSARMHQELNDQLEREADVIRHGDHAAVRTHFLGLARRRVALSDAEAHTWGVLELFVIVLSCFAFVRATDVTGEPGTIYALIAYVWNYVASFDAVPSSVQDLANIRDIVARLDHDDTDPDDTDHGEADERA
jgi:hypothetical protein